MLAVCPQQNAGAQIAVVVHRSSPLTSASSEELRRIFLGSTKTHADGSPVAVLESPTLRERFYRELLGMSADQVKRRWIQLVFAGEISTPPAQFADEADLKKFIATHPGAIGFISFAAVDGTVKALQIDGAAPANPGYKLK